MSEPAEHMEEQLEQEVSETQETTPEATPESSQEPADWRADLPDDLRKTAERFTSKEDAVRAIVAFQKREGQVRVPGKNASEDEVAAYHKAIGVPETADGYDFGEAPEGGFSEQDLASQKLWGDRFHSLGISKDVASQLNEMVTQDYEAMMQAEVDADTAFAKEQEEQLRQEWKGEDYDKNITLANRAFGELANRAGLDINELARIELKDGRFLMDRAEMSRIFAMIGREMAEGSLGPSLTEDERETVDNELEDIRKQITEAQANGDNKKANKLYQKEQALIKKRDGSESIVGSNGRMA